MHKTKPEAVREAVWLEEQCLRRQGGYDLDRTNIPSTVKWLAKGTVFKLGTDGKAVVVKSAPRNREGFCRCNNLEDCQWFSLSGWRHHRW